MRWEFKAEVIQWGGPAPYFFVATPEDVVLVLLSVGG